MDDSENCAQQPEQWRNHSNIGEVNNTVVQACGHSCSLGLGDLADLLKICVRIFGREIEHFLHDARDRFAMSIGNRQQAEIIAFTQQRIRRGHVTARNHGPAPDRHQVNNHQRNEKDRQQNQRNHHRPRFEERLQDGL